MKFISDKYKEELLAKTLEFETMYGDLIEKVLNENTKEMHTMLMESDFENYLFLNEIEKTELSQVQNADLADFNSYEKELEKIGDGTETW